MGTGWSVKEAICVTSIKGIHLVFAAHMWVFVSTFCGHLVWPTFVRYGLRDLQG